MEAAKHREAIPIGMVGKYLDTKDPWIEAQQGNPDNNEWHNPPVDPDFLAKLLSNLPSRHLLETQVNKIQDTISN